VPQINADGARLHYQESGRSDGPVLVFSNSLGSDRSMWAGQVPAFGVSHRVVCYDSRGHGASSVGPVPYNIAMLGRDVLALMDALQVDRFSFCGISMGGLTGMWLGMHCADRLERLALCNTAARIGSDALWNARIEKVSAGGVAAISDAVLERWFTSGFAAREPQILRRMRAMMEAVPAEGYVASCAAVRDADFRGTVRDIVAPTLVIAGTHDVAATPADGRYLVAEIAGSKYVELPGAHISNVECETAFNASLSAFLEAEA